MNGNLKLSFGWLDYDAFLIASMLTNCLLTYNSKYITLTKNVGLAYQLSIASILYAFDSFNLTATVDGFNVITKNLQIVKLLQINFDIF